MHLVDITIPNWAKFNARTDRANFTWLRFQNDFFQDQKIFGLTDGDIILFMMLLCEASKKNRGDITVNLDLLAALRKTTIKKLQKSLAELLKRKLITGADLHPAVDDRHHLVASGLATNERTNETNEQTHGSELPTTSALPRLAVIWNENCGKLARVSKSNAVRDRRAKARLTDHSEGEWMEIVKRIAGSDFCTGKGQRGWRATFDWLLQPDTSLKVLEGKFDNHAPNGGIDWTEYDRMRAEELGAS